MEEYNNIKEVKKSLEQIRKAMNDGTFSFISFDTQSLFTRATNEIYASDEHIFITNHNNEFNFHIDGDSFPLFSFLLNEDMQKFRVTKYKREDNTSELRLNVWNKTNEKECFTLSMYY